MDPLLAALVARMERLLDALEEGRDPRRPSGGSSAYAARVADLEAAGADRVADLLRPGPVLLRLAVHGFGVTLE